MNRVANSTKSTDLFGSGKHGFSDGVPSVTPPTILDSAVMNPVVEEIARTVEDAAVTLSTSDLGQMSQVLVARMELNELMNPSRSYDTGGANAMRGGAVRDTGLICLAGDAGKIFTTPDYGATLTARTAANSYTDDFSDIVWTGTTFIAVGETGEIQTSPDGITWTHIATGVTDLFSSVATDGTGICNAVAASNGVKFFSSNHGATWAATAQINAGTWGAARIVYDNGVWLVCGNPGGSDPTKNIYRSTTGGTFTAVNLTSVLPSGYTVIDVAARTNRGWVAQATKSASPDVILVSADGLTWTLAATLSGATKRLVCGRALIALVGLPAIYTSYDGATWAEHRSLGWTDAPNRYQQLRVYDTSFFIAHAVSTDAGKGNLSRRIAR